jgi:hypothetical protein
MQYVHIIKNNSDSPNTPLHRHTPSLTFKNCNSILTFNFLASELYKFYILILILKFVMKQESQRNLYL